MMTENNEEVRNGKTSAGRASRVGPELAGADPGKCDELIVIRLDAGMSRWLDHAAGVLCFKPAELAQFMFESWVDSRLEEMEDDPAVLAEEYESVVYERESDARRAHANLRAILGEEQSGNLEGPVWAGMRKQPGT